MCDLLFVIHTVVMGLGIWSLWSEVLRDYLIYLFLLFTHQKKKQIEEKSGTSGGSKRILSREK